jgi:phosphatidylglycerol---prolipoprotein diacylglyceryl transferase
MIACAIGRIGCQVSGDGDWGVFNSAYVSDASGNTSVAAPGDFEKKLAQNAGYFTEGQALDSTGKPMLNAAGRPSYITDRTYGTLEAVPHKSFKGPGFLPDWFFAYSYPQNVNKDGILMPGIKDEHNRVLPQPVFPTPLYEIVMCSLLFLFLMAIRKKITTPVVLFGIYLVVNGIERFLIESIRVNKLYNIAGMHISQAQGIAIMLVLSGLITILWAKKTQFPS